MIDVTEELVEAISDDTALAAILGARVFGFYIPSGAATPLCVVAPNQDTPAAAPTTAWWRSLVSVDFQSDDPATSLALATRMRELAPTIVGVRATCVISDCQVSTVQPIADDGWTPTRFRQVVTVDLTAREL